jgi:hypothetical protein
MFIQRYAAKNRYQMCLCEIYSNILMPLGVWLSFGTNFYSALSSPLVQIEKLNELHANGLKINLRIYFFNRLQNAVTIDEPKIK